MAPTLLSLVFGCVLLVVGVVCSPTRRQFSPPETSSFGPVAAVTSDGEVWDETDEFDLDGDEDWLGESALASPSSLPLRPDYDDYDDSSSSKRLAEDDDVEVQEAEEGEDEGGQDRRNSAEFLFLPSTDRRLMLQDDDADQSGLIKVRHTGKNSYAEVESNSLEEGSQKDEEDDQFEFTVGDDDDDEKDEDLQKDDFVLEDTRSKEDKDGDFQKDDFVLEDTRSKEDKDEDLEKDDFEDTRSKDIGESPRPVTRDDDDDNDEGDDDDEDEAMFKSPEEDSQVIYGDHVFLY